MRIVIDMQGAQSTGSRNRGIGRYTLSLAQAIVRNRGNHEVFLALNGLFPDAIEPIRAAFDELLPQENIRVWQAPGPVHSVSNENNWRRHTAELVREAFLASLKPDIVVVSSLFEGLVDDAVTSVGTLSNTVPTAVLLYDLIPLIQRSLTLKTRWWRHGTRANWTTCAAPTCCLPFPNHPGKRVSVTSVFRLMRASIFRRLPTRIFSLQIGIEREAECANVTGYFGHL